MNSFKTNSIWMWEKSHPLLAIIICMHPQFSQILIITCRLISNTKLPQNVSEIHFLILHQ
uniref:Uncharacterized protein n=1 Tax=Zea mays TaxID=4577 RepID=C4J229_MAIZE|nr:unknown [Zea mays]